MKRVLVFAPHPDDEVIGCGGSILLHTYQGDQVTVVFMTSGEAGTLINIPDRETLAKTRELEAQAAGEVLGTQESIFLRQPDGYVSVTPELSKKVIHIIRQHQPEIIYLPHQHESHKDHQATFELVSEAAARSGSHAFGIADEQPWFVTTILAYEVWTPLSRFQLVTDISSVIDQKIIALQKHASQLGRVQYDEAARSLSRYRGLLTQKGAYAECFEVLKISAI